MKTFLKFMLIIGLFNYSNECNSHVKNDSSEHLTNHRYNSESNSEQTKFSMNTVYVLLEEQ